MILIIKFYTRNCQFTLVNKIKDWPRARARAKVRVLGP